MGKIIKFRKVVEWEKKPDWFNIIYYSFAIVVMGFLVIVVFISKGFGTEQPYWSGLVEGGVIVYFIFTFFKGLGKGKKVYYEEVK